MASHFSLDVSHVQDELEELENDALPRSLRTNEDGEIGEVDIRAGDGADVLE
jgi:hypothetical protein